jgi:hypothetical protein
LVDPFLRVASPAIATGKTHLVAALGAAEKPEIHQFNPPHTGPPVIPVSLAATQQQVNEFWKKSLNYK